MPRFPKYFLAFWLCLGALAHAQEADLDLRGAVGEEDIDPLLDDPSSRQAARGAGQTSVLGRSNTATAERGSTGLRLGNRATAARPFSDRLAAVSRNGGNGTVIDQGVYAGDTTFDAPRGLRVGTFTIIPELTVTGGWTDNQSRSANGESGQLYRFSPNITATSDWSRHQLDFALRGTFVGYPDSSDNDDTNATASARLRLDVSTRTSVTAGLAYSYSQEDSSSAESANGTDDVHSLSLDLGATRDAGIVSVTANTGVNRSIYTADDNGGMSNSSSRDNTLYSAGLRLNGNTGSMLTPFVEGSFLLRRFDKTCSDSICEDRNSKGYELRGGVAIASGPKLNGEIGAGYRIEDLDDKRLDDIAGLTVDGSLVWSPSRLTTVTAGLGTSFDTTDIDGASGSILYSGDLRIAHGFSDRLSGELGLGYQMRDYQGVDIEERTLTGQAGLTYALSRNVALTTQYTHRRFDSSNNASDYTENSIEAGVRFRH